MKAGKCKLNPRENVEKFIKHRQERRGPGGGENIEAVNEPDDAKVDIEQLDLGVGLLAQLVRASC